MELPRGETDRPARRLEEEEEGSVLLTDLVRIPEHSFIQVEKLLFELKNSSRVTSYVKS